MRRLSLALATLALGIAPASTLAQHGPANNSAPGEVTLSPEDLLEPYYAKLRQTVKLPSAGPNASLASDTTLTRIAFGSCNHQSLQQDYWDLIAKENPQAFLMIGDNVYGDNDWDGDAALESLRRAYADQAAHSAFQTFRANVPMMATWDDHDYGLNDKGASFPMRRWAEEMFETFWGSSAQVRSRPGIYDSAMVGPEGKRVQFLLLDTRYFRSDLKRMPYQRPRPPLGIYVPDDNPDKTVLGDAQWQWLEQELAKPADLRIVVSSIQVITQAHNYEAWYNFPRERSRLLEMLGGREDSGMVMLTGDRHSGGIYKAQAGDETMWELTSSSLNLAFGDIENSTKREPDPARVSKFYGVENFGLVDIDWNAKQLTMTLKGNEGQTHAAQSFTW